MIADARVILQQEHLGLIDGMGISPHIYMVLRRPKITVDIKTVTFTEDTFEATFKKQVKDKFIDVKVKSQNLLGSPDIKMICNYPYTEYEIEDNNSGEIIANGKCALLLKSMGTQYWKHLDLEVLYVGQSYGKDGSRTASDRLKSHSTLQGIYSEAIRNSPDQDIWLFLGTFTTMLLGSFDGRSKNYETTIKQDSDHISRVTTTPITEQQKINFTEAALIKYFQPEYNKIYKDTFPNPAHSTYSECYDIDLNMISVELQSEELGARFYSNSVAPKWVHFCTFPLHSEQDRVYMFDFNGMKAL